jgi:hypothetical protein
MIVIENPVHADDESIKEDYGADSIMSMIASNPKTNTKTLRILADDKNDEVRQCVAENKRISLETLRLLAYDKNEFVRLYVAENPKTPMEILQMLAYDESSLVKSCVAKKIENDRKTTIDWNDKEYWAKQLANKKTNKKSGCFVATACYGNYNAPEVLVLRTYRDEHLLTNWLGSLFVRFYYFVSPPLAKQIEKSEKAKKFIRKYFLKPIVKRISNK